MTTTQKRQTFLVALALPARVYLGMVFILASLFKIYDPYAFGLSVATYQILPLWTVNIFAMVLPWIECIVGISLVLGFWTKESAFILSGMMVMFLMALTIALTNDLQMSCGCFASQEAADEIGIHTIFRDLAWLALGVYTMLIDDGRFGLDGLFRRKKLPA